MEVEPRVGACGRRLDSRSLHQSPKANGSPLAFFLAVYCGLAGVHGGLCGLPGSAMRPVPGPISLSRGDFSPLVGGGLWAKSASPRKLSLTKPWVTRGRLEQFGSDHCLLEGNNFAAENLGRAGAKAGPYANDAALYNRLFTQLA